MLGMAWHDMLASWAVLEKTFRVSGARRAETDDGSASGAVDLPFSLYWIVKRALAGAEACAVLFVDRPHADVGTLPASSQRKGTKSSHVVAFDPDFDAEIRIQHVQVVYDDTEHRECLNLRWKNWCD